MNGCDTQTRSSEYRDYDSKILVDALFCHDHQHNKNITAKGMNGLDDRGRYSHLEAFIIFIIFIIILKLFFYLLRGTYEFNNIYLSVR